MTKTKTTKSALFASALSLLLCVSMLIGSTFAWFTDTATTGVNLIQSGNLDLVLEYLDEDGKWTEVKEDTKLFKDGALWEPGYTEVAYIRVRNNGSLAFNYQLAVNAVNEVAGVNVGGQSFNLSNYIKFGKVVSKTEISKYATREDAQAAVTDITTLQSYSKTEVLLPKEVTYLALVVYMPTTVGNEANHNGANKPSIDLGVVVNATQTPHENDSFGNDYDKNAANAPVSVSTAAEILEAINEGKNVVLEADIALSSAMTIAADKDVIIDLNGNDITATAGTFAIENHGKLVLEDSKETGSIKARIGVDNYGTLVMNSGTIVADEQGGAAVYNNADSGATFVMNGGTLKATYVGSYADSSGGACVRNLAGCKTVITNGTLTSTSARTYAIISNGALEITPATGSNVTMTAYRGIAVDDGTATINGGTFTVLDANEVEGTYVAYETYYALYVGGNGSVVTVNGGTFTAPDSSVWRPDWDEEATDLVINGGTFNGSLIGNANYYPSKHIVVKGGTFNEDPRSYLAEGYKVSNNGNGTYTVSVIE